MEHAASGGAEGAAMGGVLAVERVVLRDQPDPEQAGLGGESVVQVGEQKPAVRSAARRPMSS